MNIAKRNSAIAVFTLASIFIFSFVANVNTARSIPLCFFKYMSHLDCPGCGLTRSFISLSHGQFVDAIHFNVLGPFIYFYFLLYLLKHLINLISNKNLNFHWQLPGWFSVFFILLFFGQWILKISYQVFLNS